MYKILRFNTFFFIPVHQFVTAKMTVLANNCFSCKEEVSYSKILEEAECLIETNPDCVSLLLAKITNPEKLTDRQKAD